ncbi:MAG: tetratricopeptide repeat protein, partial [Pyrinomonadaceae bacterium]
MKRCPKCRRDYYDDTLLYCLDDGTLLLDGPGDGESKTAIFPVGAVLNDEKGGLPARGKRQTVSPLVLVFGAATLLVVVAGLYLLLNRNPPPLVPSVRNIDSVAYDSYLRGKVLVRSQNRGDNQTAINLLEQAVKRDPRFAAAWAELAQAYHIKTFYFVPQADRKGLIEDAEVAVEKALALDANLAEAHFARGLILWSHDKRFPHEQAIQSYRRSLTLNPNLDEAHHQLGLIYIHLGLFDKAAAEFQKALEINPGNTLARFRFGVIDLYRGKNEDALAVFKSTPLDKNPSLHAFQTATALFQLGRNDEAAAMIDKYLHDYPNDEGGVGTSVKAMLLAKAGREREAEEAVKRADEIGRNFGHFHHAAYNIASAYALLKKPEKAEEWLQLAADDGFPCYPLFDSDANLKNLRQDARFVTFMAKL